MIAEQIIERYAKSFPEFRDCKPIEVEKKQWVAISDPEAFSMSGNCIVVTSDNGAGFKFAPYVASKICSHLDVKNPYPLITRLSI